MPKQALKEQRFRRQKKILVFFIKFKTVSVKLTAQQQSTIKLTYFLIRFKLYHILRHTGLR